MLFSFDLSMRSSLSFHWHTMRAPLSLFSIRDIDMLMPGYKCLIYSTLMFSSIFMIGICCNTDFFV